MITFAKAKAIHSRDPRKRAICDALRAVNGLPPGRGKVTNVCENPVAYSGRVHASPRAGIGGSYGRVVDTIVPKG